MTHERLAQESVPSALLALKESGELTAGDQETLEAHRERHVAHLEKLSKKTPSGGRWAMAALAAAALLSVAVFSQRFPSPADGAKPSIQVITAHSGFEIRSPQANAPDRSSLHLGEALVAREDGVQLKLPSEAQGTLGADSEIQVGALGAREALFLSSGWIELEVPKLIEGHSLVVETDDAQVRVVGTRFRVERRGEGTCVDVREGIVEVRADEKLHRLTIGQSHCSAGAEQQRTVAEMTSSPFSDPATPPLNQEQKQAPSKGKSPSKGTRSGSTATPDQPEETRSSLVEENKLLSGALAKRRQGKSQEAIKMLDRFLARYPDSPLIGLVKKERRLIVEESAADADGKE